MLKLPTLIPVPSNFGIVPITKRPQFVCMSYDSENKMAKAWVEDWKTSCKVVPVTHPLSLRVGSIFQNILEASTRDVKHINKFNWEVSLVHEDGAHYGGLCFGGGKIIFNNAYGNGDDDAIATVVGHEVGHVVARHVPEIYRDYMFKDLVLGITTLFHFLLHKFVPNFPDANTLSDILVWLPLSRKRELEAHYIGFQLMASAGYDPRSALDYHCRSGCALEDEYLSTHPSAKRTVDFLTQPAVMEKALASYEARRREIKDFNVQNFLSTCAVSGQKNESKLVTQVQFKEKLHRLYKDVRVGHKNVDFWSFCLKNLLRLIGSVGIGFQLSGAGNSIHINLEPLTVLSYTFKQKSRL